MVSTIILAAGMVSAAPFQTPASHVVGKYSGEVREYKPGKTLTVDIGGQRVKSWDLTDQNATFSIDPHVANTAKVSITETKDDSGHEQVTVVLGSHRPR